MRKKTSLTIVERAMVLVPEFKSRAVKLEHQVVLRGQSASTLNNYIRRIALFVIHFEKLPEQVSEDEINEWRHIGKYDNSLYPVHQLSAAFKGKFLDCIKRELRKLSAMDGFKASIEKAHQKKWVVYCESSMAGAEHVIRYLGQYTHRIAISNQRILNVDPTHVTFVAKDYRDRAQKFDLTKCPHCKEGRLIVIRTLPRIRSPAANLPSMLFAKLQ